MIKMLNINKIDKYFRNRRVADARVVGGKNTHNGMGRLLLKSNTHKGTNIYTIVTTNILPLWGSLKRKFTFEV